MAIEKKEVYIIRLKEGKSVSAVCASFKECVDLYGEENIAGMDKVCCYEEPEQEV